MLVQRLLQQSLLHEPVQDKNIERHAKKKRKEGNLEPTSNNNNGNSNSNNNNSNGSASPRTATLNLTRASSAPGPCETWDDKCCCRRCCCRCCCCGCCCCRCWYCCCGGIPLKTNMHQQNGCNRNLPSVREWSMSVNIAVVVVVVVVVVMLNFVKQNPIKFAS
ncbi:unnamed protein product [Polarella glacialis]|uniref:Uncharacterized protein n=1 Tax=Polarella glacialis TaxID=89957 RepID=A0A813KS45_POLGL|nr:unnamed protein product [Polarella glacialis]